MLVGALRSADHDLMTDAVFPLAVASARLGLYFANHAQYPTISGSEWRRHVVSG